MGNFHLGTSIPAWLKSQKKLEHLDFSYASILGSIPSWFWETISNLALLNVSFNQLHGQLPSPLNVALNAFIDLSSNLFERLIPFLVGEIEFLNLSDDTFSSPIPGDIGASMSKLFSLSFNWILVLIAKKISFFHSETQKPLVKKIKSLKLKFLC